MFGSSTLLAIHFISILNISMLIPAQTDKLLVFLKAFLLILNNNLKINVTFNIFFMYIFTAKDSGTELEDSGNNTVDRAQYEDLLQEYKELSDTMSNTKRELLKLQDLVSST
jgi:uncharacterized membrane protein